MKTAFDIASLIDKLCYSGMGERKFGEQRKLSDISMLGFSAEWHTS